MIGAANRINIPDCHLRHASKTRSRNGYASGRAARGDAPSPPQRAAAWHQKSDNADKRQGVAISGKYNAESMPTGRNATLAEQGYRLQWLIKAGETTPNVRPAVGPPTSCTTARPEVEAAFAVAGERTSPDPYIRAIGSKTGGVTVAYGGGYAPRDGKINASHDDRMQRIARSSIPLKHRKAIEASGLLKK